MDRSIRTKDTLSASLAPRPAEATVSAGFCLKIAAGFIVLMLALHLARAVMLYELEINRFGIILGRFDLNAEGAVPSWFSSLLLAASGVTVLAIATLKQQVRDRYRLHWLLIGLMFVYLSADEAAEIHEMWRHYLMPYTNWTGVFFYRSTVPNVILATVVGLLLLPFARALGRGTQIRLLASAALYVAGAIGVEMLGGAHHEALGMENLRYQLLVAAEETLEMFGALGFAAAFLHYLRHWTDRPQLTLAA